MNDEQLIRSVHARTITHAILDRPGIFTYVKKVHIDCDDNVTATVRTFANSTKDYVNFEIRFNLRDVRVEE